MILWLLLFLGIITYFILQRSVAPTTSTPIWILWLVMMTPAFIWTGWVLVRGDNEPIPVALVIGPFLLCPLIYWWLIQLGRQGPNPPLSQSTTQSLKVDSLQRAEETDGILRPLDKSEESHLRDCFPWSVFYLQNLEYRPQAVICTGTLRASPEEAYQTVKENINKYFGDRFLVIFRENFNGKPFFVLVANPYRENSTLSNAEPPTRPFLALLLLLLTIFTTTASGAEIVGVTGKAVEANPALLFKGLPYSLALIAILGCHEMGHYIAARFYNIRTTLPYFIPVPFFLGTFGAFIQMRSPMPNRKALFDVSLAGPVAGLIITLPLLIWGLANSEIVSMPEKTGILTFKALNPSFSLLLTVLSQLALKGQLTADSAIALHPIAVAGYIGLLVTAFNLMPVGQLDGGHIVHAMFGLRTSMVISQITRFLMLILSLIRPELLLWALLLFLIPIRDEPALNDVTELDDRRDFCGLVSLAVLIMIVLPVPSILMNWLLR